MQSLVLGMLDAARKERAGSGSRASELRAEGKGSRYQLQYQVLPGAVVLPARYILTAHFEGGNLEIGLPDIY